MTQFSGVSVVFTRSKKGKKKRYDLIIHTVACGDDPERERERDAIVYKTHVLGFFF